MLENKYKVQKISLPPNTFSISKISDNLRKKCEKYLADRKIPIDNLFFCISGKYANRIIIPYYDQDKNLIYWNGRDVTDKSPERYKGPEAEIGVGKGDVLFIEKWKEKKVYLCEGEFDAKSLTLSGLNGIASGGKNITDNQLEILRKYEVCICFDNDKSGAEALYEVGDKLIGNGIETSYVRPPMGIKDWNKMLVEHGEEKIKSYISKQESQFTIWSSIRLKNFNVQKTK